MSIPKNKYKIALDMPKIDEVKVHTVLFYKIHLVRFLFQMCSIKSNQTF